MDRKNSQRKLILEYLKTNKKGITSIEAFKLFNCTRLSAVVFDLKKAGNNIVSETERTDDGKHYSRYILKGE